MKSSERPTCTNSSAVVSPIAGMAAVLMTLLAAVASAQTSPWMAGSDGAIYYSGGNVGIGNGNPVYKLDVMGTIGSVVPSYSSPADAGTTPAPGDRFVVWEASTPYRSTIGMSANGLYLQNTGGSQPNDGMRFFTGSSEATEQMRITRDGNVGIGTTAPQYKLAVNGTIGTKEVIVTNTGWADYVLKPGYALRPLSHVEAYIRENQRLPEMPSESEIKEKGVGLVEMQVKLLAKVEELTLHVIELDKQNKELRRELTRLTNQGASR